MNKIGIRFLLTVGILFGLGYYTPNQAQVVLKPGITSQDGQTWHEILVGYGFILSEGYATDYTGIYAVTLGVGAGIETNDLETSPKISVGINTGGPFSITGSLNVNYFAQRDQKLAFTPEIGGALMKLLHITYGYRFNTVRESGKRSNPHRFSFFLTIPMPWFRR